MRTRTMRLALAAVVWGIAAWAGPGVGAGVVIDNLSQPVGGQDGTGLTNAGNIFTTGAVPEGLEDVILLLNGDLGGSLSDVGLFSSVAGLPGSELVSFGSVTPTLAGDNPYTLTPSAPITLAADTQYFLLVTYSGAPVLDYTLSTTYSGSGTLDGYAESADGGHEYFTFPIVDGPYQMRIDAAAVPEPSSLALLGIGAILIYGYRLRDCRLTRPADPAST
jgi:PEP-CTERM motif